MCKTSEELYVRLPPKQQDVRCADCGAPMVLLSTRKFTTKLGEPRLFYSCTTKGCGATHGAHPDGKPLGVPGTIATKAARRRAHLAFDTLWDGENAPFRRGRAYRLLSAAMGREQIHIGELNESECDEVIVQVERIKRGEVDIEK